MNLLRSVCGLMCLGTISACANSPKALDPNPVGPEDALVFGRASVKFNESDFSNYCSLKLSSSDGDSVRLHPNENGFFAAWVKPGKHRLTFLRCTHIDVPVSHQAYYELITEEASLKSGLANYLGSLEFKIDQRIRPPQPLEYSALLLSANPVSQGLAAPQMDYGKRLLSASVKDDLTTDLKELKRRVPKIKLPEQLALISGVKYAILVKMAEDRKTRLKMGQGGRTPEQEALFQTELKRAREFEEGEFYFDAFWAYRTIGDRIPLNAPEAKQIEASLTEHQKNPTGELFSSFWSSRTLTEDGPGWTHQIEPIGLRWPSFLEGVGPGRFMMTATWTQFRKFSRYGVHFDVAQEWLNIRRWSLATGLGFGMSVRPLGKDSDEGGFGGRFFAEVGVRFLSRMELFLRDELGFLSHSSHRRMHSLGLGIRLYH